MANPYEDGLREVRRRKNAMFFVIIGYIPFGFTAAKLCEFARLDVNRVMPFLVFPYFGFFLAMAIRLHVVRCPRCGNRFHGRLFYNNAVTRSCLHCGLHLDGSG